MNVLQEIFRDHFEEMVYTLHPRQSVIDNVERMIGCGDWRNGYAVYGCDNCDKLKIVPFHCKSRFCPTCGNKYNAQRATAMSFKIINVKHRHCVFTIAEELRPFFLKDRSLLDCLFKSVRDVVLNMFHKDNKSKNFTPGIICVLHTFGRDLKWNPHIHCLISEGGISDDMEWRKKDFFPYKLMRDSFQTVLLNRLEDKLGSSFKAVKSSIYKNHKNGFYVYAKPTDLPPKDAIKYIGRYLGRPVIATSRIDNYDGDTVTFHYNRHEDDALVTENVPVMEFIERLIKHIPEYNFKMIRYYGIYARHRTADRNIRRAVPKDRHKFYLSLNRWRNMTYISFGYDPTKCPCCKKTMSIIEVCPRKRAIPLQERYERIMARAKLRPPS